MGKQGKGRFRHLSHSNKATIAGLLSSGLSLRKIARRIGFSTSTVSREIRRGTVFREGDGYGYGKSCRRLGKGALTVCNQCPRHGCCRFDRKYYDVDASIKRASETKHTKCAGPRVKLSVLKAVDEIIRAGTEKGQSLASIRQYSPEAAAFSEVTLRRWIAGGYLSTKDANLRRKPRYAKKYAYRAEKKANFGLNAADKANRMMEDYRAFLEEHPGALMIQTDSVEGRKGDSRRLLTVMFVRECFQLAVLYPVAAASMSVRERLEGVLEDVLACTEREIAVLTDNGTEFAGIVALEQLSPRVRVFFADPYRSTDKAECERNHEFIRYVIPKGRTLDAFSQDMIDTLMSNINSYARESLQWKTPLARLREVLGTKVPEKWHIREIPPSQVNLRNPF